jgi:hypothetical protein
MDVSETETREEIERRMKAGLMNALHTPAKQAVPSKKQPKESQSK